ncbi:hypothetical protein RRG08_065019, partial [Elysia crispata]
LHASGCNSPSPTTTNGSKRLTRQCVKTMSSLHGGNKEQQCAHEEQTHAINVSSLGRNLLNLRCSSQAC